MGEPDTAEPDEARRIATEARDRVRFEEEALALADQVYRVARRFVTTREEAEDLVQDTYARAFRSWQSYTPGRTCARGSCGSSRTSTSTADAGCSAGPTRRRSRSTTTTSRTGSRSPGGEQALDQDRVVERLSQDSIVTALSSLPDDFRDVVVLVDIGDFSYADAAQILDVPIGTVMSRLHRGRRLLKARLAEEAVT